MEFAGCLGTELLTSTHSSTSTLVQMAEEREASLTLGTSGCPPVMGVVTLVQGIWKAELNHVSQLTPLQSFAGTSRMRPFSSWGVCAVSVPSQGMEGLLASSERPRK